MPYDCWRGMVGMIKPTKGSGSLVELIKMLPEGIGVIPLFNNVRHGKIEEFQSAIPAYEEKIAELSEDKVDLIHPAGTPPFMLLGYQGEAELIAKWEKRFRVPIFTSGTNQVSAMKALGLRSSSALATTSMIQASSRAISPMRDSMSWRWKNFRARGKRSADCRQRISTIKHETCFCAVVMPTQFISRVASCAFLISSNRSSRISAFR